MIDKVIKVIVDFLNGNIDRNIFKDKIHSLIDKKQEKLYKEDEEAADLMTNELLEICDKASLDNEEFSEEINAIFEEIKNIIEI